MDPGRLFWSGWNRRSSALLLCLAALASCKGEDPKADGRNPRRPGGAPVSVRVAPVRQDRLAYTLQATGAAVPHTEIKLSALLEARVLRVEVREGHRVGQGQLLILQDEAESRHQYELSRAEAQAARSRLRKLLKGNRPEEITEAVAAVSQAEALSARTRAEVESVRAKKKEAETNASMYERMFRQGIVSSQQHLAAKTQAEATAANLAETEAKLRESEAALQAAKARLALMRAGSREEDIDAARSDLLRAEENAKLLRIRLEHARTTAPIAGIVSERKVEPGDLARIGTHMMTLVDTGHLRIRTQISELELARIRIRQPVEVTFDAYPRRKFQGRVEGIFPTVDPNSHQAVIEVGLVNPGNEIPSGLLARLTFVSHADQETLILPKAALVRQVQGDRYEVFVARPARPGGDPGGASRDGGPAGPTRDAVRPASADGGGRMQAGGSPPGEPRRKDARRTAAPPAWNGGAGHSPSPDGPSPWNREGAGPSSGAARRPREGGGGSPAPTHRAESRKIEIGEIQGEWAEIKSGLQAGDLVVVQGQSRVQAGSALRVSP